MKNAIALAATVLLFAGCASNPPVDNEPARARAHAAYDAADEEFGEKPTPSQSVKARDEGPAVIAVSNATFKSQPTVLVAPAMNEGMYLNAATQANLATLRTRGVVFVEPGEGELACGTTGVGRLADPAEIFSVAHALRS